MNDELHHQLPNNLRLKNSGKEKIAGHFVHTKNKKSPKNEWRCSLCQAFFSKLKIWQKR